MEASKASSAVVLPQSEAWSRFNYLVVTACLLALATVSWFVESVQVARLCVIVSFFGILALVIAESTRMLFGCGRPGQFIIIAGTFFWFLIDAFLMATDHVPFRSNYGDYQPFSSDIPIEIVSLGLICVQLFLLSALIAIWYLPVPQRILKVIALREDRFNGLAVDLFCFALAAIAYLPFVISAQGDVLAIVGSLLQMRGEEGGALGLYEDPGLTRHMLYLGLFAGTIATARLAVGAPGSWTLRFLATVLTAFWVFLSGTRFQMAFLIMPVFVLLLERQFIGTQWRRMRTRAIVIASVILLSMWLQGALRDTGVGEIAEIERVEQVATGGATGYDHFDALLVAIDLAERRGEYFKQWILPLMLTHFVPRVWWEGKPDFESWVYYNSMVTRGGTYNVTPSVAGQYYMNWGFYGVAFAGLMFGWLARISDEWLRRVTYARHLFSACLAGFLISFLFVSFRFFHPLYVAYVLGAVLVFVAGTKRVQFEKAR